MNSKKNKNKNKGPKSNPNPPQRVETASADEKVNEKPVENPEVTLKSEERVPEIISEVLPPPVVEFEVTEVDTPKKPKRNRGKKKKSDKDDDIDDIQEEKAEPAGKESKLATESQTEVNVVVPTQSPEDQNVAPAARKKKNKNKKSNEPTEEPKTSEQDIQVVTIKQGEKTEGGIDMSDVKIVTLIPVTTETFEHESKSAKKKNKKKKRNDSERSDKAEEAVVCTSAFQKLLDAKDVKKDVNLTEQPFMSDNSGKNTMQEIVTELNKEAEKQENLQKQEELIEALKDVPKDEGGKGKKKNKKDKKHPKPESDEIQLSDAKREALFKENSAGTEPQVAETTDNKEQVSKDIFEKPAFDSTTTKDKSPMIKDQRIINPVIELPPIEKSVSPKHKDKTDITITLEKSSKVDEAKMLGDKIELKADQCIINKEKSPKREVIDNIKASKEKKIQQHHEKPAESIEKISVEDTVPKEKSPQPKRKTKVTEHEEYDDKIKDVVKETKLVSSPVSEEKGPIPQIKANIEVSKNLTEQTLQLATLEATLEKESIEKEKSPKPQAKIAKPVNKKRKDNSNDPLTETDDSDNKVTPENKPREAMKPLTFESLIAICPSKQSTMMPSFTSEASAIEDTQGKGDKVETENIQLPDSGTGKKRRKSPKPLKMPEIKDSETTINITPDIQESFKEVLMPTLPETLEVKDTCVLATDVKKDTSFTPTPVPNVAIKLDESKKPLQDMKQKPIPLPPPLTFAEPLLQNTSNVGKTDIPIQLEPVKQEADIPRLDQINLPDGGMGKKRKKSPKLPPKTPDETTGPSEMSQKRDDKQTVDDPLTKTSDGKEMTDSLSGLPSLQDIEISSIRTESEGSACDITPDVHYPRSVSQLHDNNNNMFIQDVTHDTKLNIPVVIPDTPFIQGSGETPTPELVPSGIKMTEIETTVTKPIEEKSNLKTQVMEVNQNMEALRLSIERSLAELTAIEKSEKDTEAEFEKAHAKIEAIKEISAKANTPDRKEPSSQIIIKNPDEAIKSAPDEQKHAESTLSIDPSTPPICPARKDNKGKGKTKKKGKHETEQIVATATSASTTETSATPSKSETKASTENKKEEKTEQKSDTQQKGKQQSSSTEDNNSALKPTQDTALSDATQADFEPIESFEDAMTSSADDVNKSFEFIVNEGNQITEPTQNPEISVTAPIEDDEKDDTRQKKVNPVSQPKNLLGHPDIPVRLNKTDYKKEKNKTPNARQAKVRIKDDVPIEISKESKEVQTENKRRIFTNRKSMDESMSSISHENEEFVYKYSFRKVFLPSACQVCKKELKQSRVPCSFCSLVFYCNQKHKDEDYVQHQALCFAVSTIVHLKDQKHIYADAKNVTGHNYRLLRMQMIVSCEKVLKRKLAPFEQEALLYPRMCGDVSCREHRQGKLRDCEGCGQISFCSDKPDHLSKSHQRWCKSYSLYQRLVCYQQTKGRLEPRLPSKVMSELYQIPEKMNEVLASMYEEKIDMNDIQYAALTQIATAPLTAAYCQQLYSNKMNATYANGVHKNSSFTIHVVGAELQFEADALNKWEVFFLHLRPDVKELRLVLIGADLNPSNLPLDLLGKIKLCENCQQNKRRVVFDFQDKKTYGEYWATDFATPDLVCAFNPSIQRSSTYNGKDSWPSTIKCVLKLRVPFVVTSYTMNELLRDMARIKECAEVDINTVSEPKLNSFASVRPDRNFISDDEMPLLFKNYCFMVICGAF